MVLENQKNLNDGSVFKWSTKRKLWVREWPQLHNSRLSEESWFPSASRPVQVRMELTLFLNHVTSLLIHLSYWTFPTNSKHWLCTVYKISLDLTCLYWTCISLTSISRYVLISKIIRVKSQYYLQPKGCAGGCLINWGLSAVRLVYKSFYLHFAVVL